MSHASRQNIFLPKESSSVQVWQFPVHVQRNSCCKKGAHRGPLEGHTAIASNVNGLTGTSLCLSLLFSLRHGTFLRSFQRLSSSGRGIELLQIGCIVRTTDKVKSLFPNGRNRKKQEAISNKCLTSSNRCLTSSNKKLVVTSASLLVTSALLVVTRS